MKFRNKSLFCLILFLLIPIPTFAGTLEQLASRFVNDIKDQKIKIAVMDFSSSGVENIQDSLVVRERFTTFLAQNNNTTLIERAFLEKVFQEQKIQLSGAVSTDTVKRIGELIGADAIVSGSINTLITDEVEVNARVIQVETGKILTAGQATIKKDWKYIKPLNQVDTGRVAADSAQDYYKRASQYYSEGKSGMAIEYYSKAITLKPDYWEAYYDRGTVYLSSGKDDEAIVDFSKVLDLKLDYAAAWLSRGMAYDYKADFGKAIGDYSKAIELNPNDADAYTKRGHDYHLKEELRKAMDDFNKAIELKPNNSDIYIERGDTYCSMGDFKKNLSGSGLDVYAKEDYDGAINDYNKASTLNPRDADIYVRLGDAYNQKEDYANATDNYSKALKLNPNNADAHVRRGKAYGNKGDYDKAIADFDKAIKIEPEFDDSYLSRGLAYGSKGNYDKAIEDCSKAIELNPDNINAYECRRYAYASKHNYPKVLENLHKIEELKKGKNQHGNVGL